MIEDRDYMREPEYRDPIFRRHPWTFILIAIYAVVFMAELFVARSPSANNFFAAKFPLSLNGIARGYVWQFITYQFMHANLLHIVFNSWAIFIFGRELEPLLGAKRFLTLVLSSGIIGGVFQMLVALLWPQYFGAPVVGASACAFGLVAMFAMIFPERELTMLVFFVIPIKMRAKTLLIGSAVLAGAGFVFHDVVMPGVAHAAHLGGMAMGWFYARKIAANFSGAAVEADSGVKPENSDRAQFNSRAVDDILDKISASGLKSLTAEERTVLENARKKMTRP